MKRAKYSEHNGYGQIPKSWFKENEFIEGLTNGERWILTCLTAHVWRLEKLDRRYPITKLISRLYKENQLLVAFMTQRELAERCGVNRSTIISATKKFDETGAVICVSGGGGLGHANLYVLGFEHREKTDNAYSKKTDLWFSNCPALASGEAIPSYIKEYLRSNHDKPRSQFLFTQVDESKGGIVSSVFGGPGFTASTKRTSQSDEWHRMHEIENHMEKDFYAKKERELQKMLARMEEGQVQKHAPVQH